MKKLAIISVLLICIIATGVLAQQVRRTSVTLVNQDPDPAIAGDIVELRIGVANRGLALDDVYLEIVPEYPFQALPGEDLVHHIGPLKYQTGDDLKIEKFKLRVDRDAIAGEYELKVLEYDGDAKENLIRRVLTLDVKNKESAEVIYIDKVELLPGEETPMTFTINNVGAAPLRDLTFTWENEDDIVLPVGSSDSRYIKYIEIGDKAELEYKVIASNNADPDLYKLDLTLTYDDPLTSEEKTITASAGVYVGGETDFDVAFSGATNAESSFSVSNIGSVPASSVTVRIPKQDGWRVAGSDSVIIGNLNEGDYTVASFSLAQASAQNEQRAAASPEDRQARKERMQRGDVTDMPQRSQGREAPLTIHIVYTDTRGARHTVEKEILVNPNAQTAGANRQMSGMPRAGRNASLTDQIKDNALPIGIGILALFVLSKLNQRYKRGKLKDIDYTYWKMFKEMFGDKKKK